MKRNINIRSKLAQVELSNEHVLPTLVTHEDAGSRLILDHATFMAAVHWAVQTGELDLQESNHKRLALRPLLHKMVFCVGRDNGFATQSVELLIDDLEIDRLLELSASPRDTFAIAYALGRTLQQFYVCEEEELPFRLLFSGYLQEASALFKRYATPVERWSRGMDLEKIMDKLTHEDF